jgi:hypothetical protein
MARTPSIFYGDGTITEPVMTVLGTIDFDDHDRPSSCRTGNRIRYKEVTSLDLLQQSGFEVAVVRRAIKISRDTFEEWFSWHRRTLLSACAVPAIRNLSSQWDPRGIGRCSRRTCASGMERVDPVRAITPEDVAGAEGLVAVLE